MAEFSECSWYLVELCTNVVIMVRNHGLGKYI